MVFGIKTKMRLKAIVIALAMAMTTMAQGVIDVHSHIITPGFLY